ncbi:MAG: hypothetical protein Q7V00_05165 [Sulfurimicrobium sp.]|nr:hypothetical protein [Sulfurimicrobium sp.]MDP1703906.1 hypothetical protein [Sulfurimicrobium sp.]MDP2198455.1 hypothetical protein [Sulfurimicrobium sp.]
MNHLFEIRIGNKSLTRLILAISGLLITTYATSLPAIASGHENQASNTSVASKDGVQTISFAMNACSDYLISVFGLIPKSIDLKSFPPKGNYKLNGLPNKPLREAFEQASAYAHEHCAKQQYDPNIAFAVNFFYERMPRPGEPMAKWNPMPAISAGAKGDAANPEWEIFNSVAYAETKEGKEEQQRITHRQNDQRANVEFENKKMMFFKTNGVDGFYNPIALNRNPFAMQGKPVLLWARLSQMIEANKAIVSLGDGFAVVSGVPTGAFGGGYYLFFGRVLGNTSFPGNLKQTPVAHLKFIRVIPCPAGDLSKCI